VRSALGKPAPEGREGGGPLRTVPLTVTTAAPLLDCRVPCPPGDFHRCRPLSGPLRAGLALGLASVVPGCLIEPPPDFELTPTPPVLYLDQAAPSVGHPIQMESNEPPINFSVPFFWDGVGGPLKARLYTGLGAERTPVMNAIPVIESEVQFAFVPQRPLAPGCHQITLILTHESNYDTDLLSAKTIDPELVALATWWMALDTPLADLSLADCARVGGDAVGAF
jgi:hypothetical protein